MYRDVLVGVDERDGATAAVDAALDLAAAHGATLHARYVVDVRMNPLTEDVPESDVEDVLADARERTVAPVERAAEERGVDCDAAVRRGVPHEELVAAADDVDADVVVVGARGRTGLERRLLGSVAERVLRTADRPVLVVPVAAEKF